MPPVSLHYLRFDEKEWKSTWSSSLYGRVVIRPRGGPVATQLPMCSGDIEWIEKLCAIESKLITFTFRLLNRSEPSGSSRAFAYLLVSSFLSDQSNSKCGHFTHSLCAGVCPVFSRKTSSADRHIPKCFLNTPVTSGSLLWGGCPSYQAAPLHYATTSPGFLHVELRGCRWAMERKLSWSAPATAVSPGMSPEEV